MRKFVFISRWISVIFLLVILLLFTDERQVKQKVSLNQIIIEESTDNFVNKQIVLNYLKDKSVFFDNVPVFTILVKLVPSPWNDKASSLPNEAVTNIAWNNSELVAA